MTVEVKKRKTRSDKKRDIKPTIPITLKESIYRLSYITNTPVKDVSEYLLVSGLQSKKIMDELSNYFRRGLIIGNTVFIGDLERTSIQQKRRGGKKERITIRVDASTYENINSLAYALDCTPSTAAAILLEVSIQDVHNVNRYAKRYFKNKLDETRMRELKEILKYIERNNPYDEKFSWMEMLNYFVEEVRVEITQFGKGVSKWIEQKRKK
jgi:hypothetical protein